MISGLEVAGCVELAVVERCGMIESRHLGAAAVVDATGAVLTRLGDIDALIYPRSTLKPMQAIAVLRSGVQLGGEQLVLATSSHPGTPAHVRVVRELLDRAGLTDDALQCPAEWPGDTQASRDVRGPARVTMNCSGKHAAFLLACVTNRWPLDSYLEPEHPLQLLIAQTIESYTGETIVHSGLDGCGAPLHAVTLRGLATAIAKISSASVRDDPFAAMISRAIRENPWALDSPAVAEVIGELGLIAKNGAEGVFVAGMVDGTAVALKMLDGSTRASIPVALSLLGHRLDADAVAAVLENTTERVTARGLDVGFVRSVV